MEARRDYTDLIAGGLMIVIGFAGAIYASTHYPLGTVSRMGPGMFPTAIGYLMAALGVLIALPALTRRGTVLLPEWRPMFLVLASVIAFAMTIEVIGMVPSIFLVVGLGVLADVKLGYKGFLVLAALVSVGAWLIFKVGLGVPLYLFVWPF